MKRKALIRLGLADDQTVQYKKSMFYRVLLPLVLYENDAVLAERESLEALAVEAGTRFLAEGFARRVEDGDTTVAEVLRIADGCIVGSSLKVDGDTWNPVDPDRAQDFMDRVRAARA